MLEYVPAWLGNLLADVRAGHDKLAIAQPELLGSAVSIDLSSPAFAHGQRLPERFTADGAGISPPLHWSHLPEATASLVLIVEDPDAPAPTPLVHAIVWDIAAGEHALPEGAIVHGENGDIGIGKVGRNSFMALGWLAPDPPAGHGSHDYVFQLFALSHRPVFGNDPDSRNPGRSAVVEALTGIVLAAGLLTGTYSRGEAPLLRDSAGSGSAVPA